MSVFTRAPNGTVLRLGALSSNVATLLTLVAYNLALVPFRCRASPAAEHIGDTVTRIIERASSLFIAQCDRDSIKVWTVRCRRHRLNMHQHEYVPACVQLYQHQISDISLRQVDSRRLDLLSMSSERANVRVDRFVRATFNVVEILTCHELGGIAIFSIKLTQFGPQFLGRVNFRDLRKCVVSKCHQDVAACFRVTLIPIFLVDSRFTTCHITPQTLRQQLSLHDPLPGSEVSRALKSGHPHLPSLIHFSHLYDHHDVVLAFPRTVESYHSSDTIPSSWCRCTFEATRH